MRQCKTEENDEDLLTNKICQQAKIWREAVAPALPVMTPLVILLKL